MALKFIAREFYIRIALGNRPLNWAQEPSLPALPKERKRHPVIKAMIKTINDVHGDINAEILEKYQIKDFSLQSPFLYSREVLIREEEEEEKLDFLAEQMKMASEGLESLAPGTTRITLENTATSPAIPRFFLK